MAYTFIICLLLLPIKVYSQGSETIELDPCSILDGGSHLIIAINESLQQDFSQFSEPEELLISGEIGTEISLKITEDKSRLFKLDGKQIRLNGPLDRDAADLSSLSLKVTCESLSNGKRRTIPLVVRVLDLNDNPPLFKGTPYIISLPENTPLNSIVFSKLASMDADANINGQVEYTLGDNGDDSPFAIESPYQGLVTLTKTLDYETTQRYFLQIKASDRALNTEDRFTSTTTLTIKVQDSDDLPPVFNHPEGYTAEVISGYPVSTLHISPEKIHAEDQDSLRTEVVYSLVDGIPINYDVYFGIDPNSGVISQRQVIDKAQYDRFEIMVRGTEKTGRHIDAKLTINVLAEDKSPPVLRSSSNNGYIDEGAEIGTYVTDINGNRIDFSITDDDIEDGVELQTLDSYDIELTTKYFQIDQEGYLIVNQSDIDRDPPFQPVLTFQIFAREKFDSFKSSSPVQLTISIRDINDNSPIFAPISDITLTAGTTRRIVTHFNATDKDSDKFIVYKLLSVSNNGRQKFFLNSKTGLLEVIAPIYDGEQYAITVEAKDNGGLSNIAVLRVNTRPMPNVQKPKFDRFLYDIKIREGVPKFTSVVETMAKDPENSPVLYSIISGNELEHFVMEESTGIVRAMSVLDREAHSSYNLTIRAQDNGGKFSTVALTITVLDENDNTPEFQNLPFSFRVTEGTLREFVGEVSAVDVDQSSNGKVFYYLNETEDTFSIEELTGRIYTLKSLDFEEQSVHYLVIGAKDNGSPALSATATATILVQDISDETPIFENPLYNISISENNEPELLLTTVQAIDKDSEPSITYRIITGDRKRFRVNQTTGDVYATHKFDYEKEFYYSLVIGTEEGFFDGELSGEAVTKVEIHIEDLNDVPPHFVKVPYGQTISIRNNVPIGQKIGSVQAEDSSGLTPIDTIGFNMSSDGSTKNADKYFGVDPVKGDILIVGNLTEDIIEEYQLEIVTYSIENPQLQSSILIRVVIKIVTSLYTGPGLGFEELEYEIDMEENAKNNLVIVSIPVLRKMKKKHVPFKCTIKSIRTNENQELQGIFVSRVNEKKECDLILNTDEIDRERNDRYEILVELQSRPEFINTDRNEVHIRVNIQDINDHSPLFEKKRYFGIVKKESLPNTPIVQVEATDRDSGSNGKILYSFQSMNNETEDLFQIDSESGIISNILELSESDVDLSKPFQLLVVAEDQSLDIKKRLVSNTNLIINVLDINANDLVLTLPKINPTEFESHRDDLINVLEDTTGYKVGIDRVDTAMIKYLNGTCCTAHYGTDVYFHVIDPIQYRILNSTENKVKTNILDSAPKLKEKVSKKLNLRVSDLHLPYNKAIPSTEVVQKAGNGDELLTYYLIVIGLAVGLFVLTTMAVIYLCCARRRIEMDLEKKEKMIVVPRYEPIFMDPPQKEYETQILQMNVPYATEDFKVLKSDSNNDDLDSNDFNMDDDMFFNLDNINYITKEDNNYN